MNWFQKTLCKSASKIISKYGWHYIDGHSVLVLNGRQYYITGYKQKDRIGEPPSLTLYGVSPITKLSNIKTK